MSWDGEERRVNVNRELSYLREKIARLEEQLGAANLALITAQASMEKRLNGMNEFRETLKDQAAQFVTRKEHDFILSDIRELRESRAMLQGKASQQSVIIAYLISIVSVFLGILNFIISHAK
jgi:hypothetical protein